IENSYVIEQSKDRKSLLLHGSAGQNSFTLLTLGDEKLQQKELILGTTVTRQLGKVGTFKALEWSLDGRHILLQHTLPAGETELISFDIGKPQEVVNITSLYGDIPPGAVH